MTRTETIDLMIQKANAIMGKNSKNWTRDAENEIWEMSLDWNSEHEEREEIFMCEYGDDDNNVIGFMIEDDYWLYEE